MKFAPAIAAAMLAFGSTAQADSAACNGADCTPSSGIVSLGSLKNATHTNGTIAEIMSKLRAQDFLKSATATTTLQAANATATSSVVATSTSKKHIPSGLPTFMMAPGPVMPTPTKALSASSSTTSFKPATFKTSYLPKPTRTAKPKITAVPERAPINLWRAYAKAGQFTDSILDDFALVEGVSDPAHRTKIEEAKRQVDFFLVALGSLYEKDFGSADNIARRVAILLKTDVIASLPHAKTTRKIGAEMMALLGHPLVSTDSRLAKRKDLSPAQTAACIFGGWLFTPDKCW